VLEPVGKLNSYFGTINAAIEKRNHKVCFRRRMRDSPVHLR
jgi:hypothetical protein